MTYNDIVDYVCGKVGETDDDARAKCLSFAKARHRQVYESFDWTAAQDTINVQVSVTDSGDVQVINGGDSPYSIIPPAPPPPPGRRPPPPPSPPPPAPPPPGQGGGSADIPINCEKVISARFNTVFLDPVTPNYIFESHPEMFLDTGVPQFYWSRYLSDQQTTAIRLFPSPETNGTLELLVKRQFDDSANELLIPNVEDVVICFVLADMWEGLRQLAVYAQKLTEAQALLTSAQTRDTPSTPKPRMSKNLTASGTTLVEMTDEVCDIVGRWEPDIRESIRDRIRRNYSQLWDALMLPESLVVANVPIDMSQEQLILPPFFDRVIECRLNGSGSSTDSIFGPIASSVKLKQAEISYYFNVDYTIFERVGAASYYSMLPSVAVQILPPFNEGILVSSSANSSGGPLMRHPRVDNPDAGVMVFVKGESGGAEFNEKIEILPGLPPGPGPTDEQTFWASLAASVNTYDTPLTITKPNTTGVITFYGASSHTELVSLQPNERERKHLRIWLLPNKNPQGVSGTSSQPGSILVLGKHRVSPLIDDLDSPQIRNVSNILINAAASDMFDRLGNAPQSQKYAAQAASQIQTLTDAETKQNAYQPVITPYVSSWGLEMGDLWD